jgi:putative oxidoreductase
MKSKLFLSVRMLAGLMLVVFGSNKFFGFLDMQPGSLEMGAFMMALFKSGYLMQLVAAVEIAAGVSFIVNRYTALMAVVLMPVMLNAFLAHLFLDPAGIAGATVLLAFTITIMYHNKERYRAILRP